MTGGILSNLDKIDVLEMVAENFQGSSKGRLRSFKTLGSEVPLILHGVSMGLASTYPVETKRLEGMARLMEALRPETWSEHLSFVRAGGIEIGHLAAPPRTFENIQGSLENLGRAARVVGCRPALENIATLVQPPVSTMDEPTWVGGILEGSDCPFLLDLHNLYANALNIGEDPLEYLERFHLDRVQMVHLSGGRWISNPQAPEPGARRWLDDHLHDVPDPVFKLLEVVARRTAGSLTIILERDGNYPSFESLLGQLELARRAVQAGVDHRNSSPEMAGVS